MIKILVISLPMLVCIFWSILLILDWWEQRTQAKARLLFFMVVSTALYGGHFIFFNHQYELMPITDTIYVAMNLLVYPLYQTYISEVTNRRPVSLRPKLLYLIFGLPALAAVLVGGTYIAMTAGQRLDFINANLYNGYTYSTTGLILLQEKK